MVNSLQDNEKMRLFQEDKCVFNSLVWRVFHKWEEEFLVFIILQRKKGKYFHTTFVFKDHTLIATVPWGRRQIAKDNIQDMREK